MVFAQNSCPQGVALLAALAFALFGVSTAAAQQNGDEAADQNEEADQNDRTRQVLKLIKQGKKAYKAEKYEEALDKFEQAYEIESKVSILVPLGRTAEELGETRQAIEYFERYLDQKPGNEKVAQRVEKLRQTLPGTLLVRSTPDAASVHLGGSDGKKLGVTPLEVELQAATYTVVVRRDGFESVEKEVGLTADTETTVSVELEEVAPEPEPVGGGGTDGTDRGDLAMWGVGTSAVGVAGLGTGVVLSIMANSAENEVNSFDRGATGANRGDLEELKSTARGRYRSSVVMYSAGTALTLAGAGMLTYHFLTDDRGQGVSWRPTGGVGADGGWAGFEARF